MIPARMAGGDKPRPYPVGRCGFVGAGFLPALQGLTQREDRPHWVYAKENRE
jgi:hypothetical protein